MLFQPITPVTYMKNRSTYGIYQISLQWSGEYHELRAGQDLLPLTWIIAVDMHVPVIQPSQLHISDYILTWLLHREEVRECDRKKCFPLHVFPTAVPCIERLALEWSQSDQTPAGRLPQEGHRVNNTWTTTFLPIKADELQQRGGDRLRVALPQIHFKKGFSVQLQDVQLADRLL